MFDCKGCAAAAIDLPSQLGCTKPTPKPLAIYKVLGHVLEINRCPRSTITAEVLDIIDRAAAGYLKRMTPAEARRLPAGLVGAVEWVTSILEEAAGEPDGRS